MNESTLVPCEEISDLDWLARNVHVWPFNMFDSKPTEKYVWHQPYCGGDILAISRDRPSVFTKDQWLARRAELQNKPRWKDAPKWAVYMAQSPNGHWEFFAVKPRAECWWRHPIGERSSAHNTSIRGAILGDWRDTLEKRPEQNEFEPFVSVEDAQQELSELEMLAKVSHLISEKRHRITPSKYTKTIHGVSVDVYDVLQAWGVSNPALQHLIKKALQCGQRGHKDNAQDLQDIIDSAIRAKELES